MVHIHWESFAQPVIWSGLRRYLGPGCEVKSARYIYKLSSVMIRGLHV
jgi:hypothetical protein